MKKVMLIILMCMASNVHAESCVILEPSICPYKAVQQDQGLYSYAVCGDDIEALETITDLFCEVSLFQAKYNKALRRNKRRQKKLLKNYSLN